MRRTLRRVIVGLGAIVALNLTNIEQSGEGEAFFSKDVALPEIGINLSQLSSEPFGAQERSMLERLVNDSIKTVVFNPVYFQDNRYSSHIDTTTSMDVRAAALAADSLGLHVSICPLLIARDWSSRSEFEPRDFSRWARDYRAIVAQNVRIAIEVRAPGVFIAKEIDWALQRDPGLFQGVISEARGAGYKGMILYAANYAGRADLAQFKQVNKLDIDAIGIDFYPPMYRRGAMRLYEPVEHLKEIHRYVTKPLFISEVGYRSIPSADQAPWDYLREGPMSEESQRLAYESILASASEMRRNGSPIMAVLFWPIDMLSYRHRMSDDALHPNRTGYSFFGKTAEQEIRAYLRSTDAPIQPFLDKGRLPPRQKEAPGEGMPEDEPR